MNPATSSRMLSTVSRTQQRDLARTAAGGGSAVRFLTLPPRSLWMNGRDDSEHDYSRPIMQAARAEPSSRQYVTFSEDTPSYTTAWSSSARRQILSSNAASQDASQDQKLKGWGSVNNASEAEQNFDPILDIRAVNPLIFENNYELDEYGPSFRETTDQHEVLIKEWRLRNETAA